MIAVGIAFVAIPVIVLVALTVDALGWKRAAAVWGSSVALTALAAGGALLIEAGLKS